VRAAELIDRNSEAFKRAVKREAQRLYNSRFMTQLNRAREKIRDEGWKLGFKHGYGEGYEKARGEFEVWFYCNICGEPITIRPNSESHKALIQTCTTTDGATRPAMKELVKWLRPCLPQLQPHACTLAHLH